MSLAIRHDLEMRIREQAEAEGVSVEAYLERLMVTEQRALEDLQKSALEGLSSGSLIEVGPTYWENKHKQLDELLGKPISQ